MLKSNHGIAIVIILIVMLFLTSCGTDEQPTMQQQEESELEQVNYESEVADSDKQVQQILNTIKLKTEDPSKTKKESKNKKTEQYQFDWDYNKYKLQVPLFGAGSKLLSEYKEEIINKFKNEFTVIDYDWSNNQQQKLVLKLGLKAKDKSKLITHQLVFTQPQPKAKMAIIIDDFGFNRRGTKEILSIKRPLTAAVLPFRPHSEKDAKLARDAGLEVLLHQPLEPMNSELKPGQGAINTDMSQQEVEDTFLKNLNSLPKVSGVNHHMGSKATTNPRIMNQFLELVKEKDLFYVDSSTSHNTVGVKIAKDKNIPTKENHLFIDNVDEQQEIEKMILRLSEVALEKGELLIIGHVKENTAQAIKKTIPELEEKGIKLVYASQMVN